MESSSLRFVATPRKDFQEDTVTFELYTLSNTSI
jgi:hypothetical protein